MTAWVWKPHAHPEVWALTALLLGAYVVCLRIHARHGERGATRSQVAFFSAGIVALLVAAEWPVHDLAEGSLYSVHMVQHLLLTLVAPPLLLLGTPGWLARALLPPRALRVARALARPLVALALFNAGLVFTHWPAIVDATVHSEVSHFLLHVLLVSTALAMWTPVFSPLLELPRLSYPAQMLYLFLQSLVPTVPASFLTFGSRPLYHVYETLPKAFGISALSDQRAAGLIMKLVGGAILWSVIIAIYFKWFHMEQDRGVDALEWGDIDRTLNRMEMNG